MHPMFCAVGEYMPVAALTAKMRSMSHLCWVMYMQAWQDNMLASSRYSAHEDVPACKIQKCLHIQGHSLLHNPTKYKAKMGLATAS